LNHIICFQYSFYYFFPLLSFIARYPIYISKTVVLRDNLFEMTTDFHTFFFLYVHRVRNNSVLLNRSKTGGGYVKVQYNSATLTITVTCIGVREQEHDSDRPAIAFQLEFLLQFHRLTYIFQPCLLKSIITSFLPCNSAFVVQLGAIVFERSILRTKLTEN